MLKTLRSLAIALFLAATFAVAATPSSAEQMFGDGSGPTPWCRPGSPDCP